MTETKFRSFVKAFSWRIIASVTTAAIAFWYGVPQHAIGAVFMTDIIIKFAFYYSHERAWSNVRWGRSSK